MYHLLLADDDAITRRGLQSLDIWEKLGIRIIETVSDGQEALEALERLPVDILLTDVKMPRMDGLQLAEEAHRKYPQLHIVFVSGYDDVGYIRQALRLQAVDYILKPISPDELAQCFQRVVDRLANEKIRQEEVQRLLESYQAGMTFMGENLLNILITSDTISEQQLQAVAKALNAMNEDSYYFVVAVHARFLNFPSSESLSRLGENIRCFLLDKKRGQFLVLISAVCRTDSSERMHLAMRIKSEFLNQGAIRCVCAYTDRDGSLWEIRSLCTQARTLLENSFCRPDGSIITSGKSEDDETLVPSPPNINVETLEGMIVSEAPNQLNDYILRLFSLLQRTGFRQAVDFLPFLTPVLQALDELIRRRFTVDEDFPGALPALINRLSEAFCLDDMKEIVLRHCKEIQDTLRSQPDGETTLRINRVKQYIQTHYNEAITLETVARQINLAPTYLCLLFREKTGQTMNAYITSVRMEKARELLSDVNLKLYDVSLAVGYPNPSYFTRLFRKYTGMTPTEYRNHCVKEGI